MTNFYEHKKELITHEVGHWIVAKELGFLVGDIKLEITGQYGEYGHQGSSKIFPAPCIESINDLSLYLENRICVLYAGVVSQLVLSEKDANYEDGENLLNTWGQKDNEIIAELLFIARGIRYPSKELISNNEIQQKKIIADECWSKTYVLIQEKRKKISYIISKIDLEIEKLEKAYTIKLKDIESFLNQSTNA